MSKIERSLFEAARPLTEKLKTRGRRRRESLVRSAAASAAPRPQRNDILPALEVVDIPLDDLRLPGRKVRGSDPAHVRNVAGSISALGFCVPVLVGKNNLVLDGAIRIEAARLLGLTRIPCMRIDHLSEVEQRALRLAVNRLGEILQLLKELFLLVRPTELLDPSERVSFRASFGCGLAGLMLMNELQQYGLGLRTLHDPVFDKRGHE